MRAVTLHQPWATLIALGVKTIETRSWPFPLTAEGEVLPGRGVPLAIHAAKSIPKYAWDAMASNVELVRPIFDARLRIQELPLGKVIAVCEVVACLRSEREPGVPWASPVFERNAPFGDFSPGRHLWLLGNIKPLVFPVSAVGHQRIWQWEPPS